MVFCKFFREGYCRYGADCRFEHSYNSKYSYHAPPTPPPAQQPPQSSGPSAEQLITSVSSDVRAAVNGKMWLLTSYGPFSKKNFPGFKDLSPEETRLSTYDAKANNNVDKAIAAHNSLVQEANSKFSKLINPDTSTIKALISVYKQENSLESFEDSSTAPNVFAVQASTAQSVFGGPSVSPSGFSGQRNSPTPQSVFAQANTTTSQSLLGGPSAKSVFGGQNSAQSVFGRQNNVASPQSVFGGQSNPSSSQSVFGQANTTQNVFHEQNSSPSSQSIFGSRSMATDMLGGQNNAPIISGTPGSFSEQTAKHAFGGQSSHNVFGQSDQTLSPSVFGQDNTNSFTSHLQTGQAQSPSLLGSPQATSFTQHANDSDCYSRAEQLSLEDLEQYKAANFEYGFIPELPPPPELCF